MFVGVVGERGGMGLGVFCEWGGFGTEQTGRKGREEKIRERGRGVRVDCTLLNSFDWCMFLLSRVQCDYVRASNAKC